MIISKTPFRISFFGGGTDYPIYYRENGGAVLSTTINKYCYINARYLPPFFDCRYRIRYAQGEDTNNIDDIKHPSVRECIRYLNLDKYPIEMVHTADIPARSGMGSSSAFTVGLLNSLISLTGRISTKRRLACDAINIEQNIIKENVGSQDQVAAAYGGLNKIQFGGGQEFDVYPITIGKEKTERLHDHLMLFFTGYQRNASDIAIDQIKNTSEKKNELGTMFGMVDNAIDIIRSSDSDITEFGKLLHNSWQIKRGLTKKITNPDIDKIYNIALENGALGGKLLGAGGGGCILLFVEPDKQDTMREKLKDLVYIPFEFENLGSHIIHYDPEKNY